MTVLGRVRTAMKLYKGTNEMFYCVLWEVDDIISLQKATRRVLSRRELKIVFRCINVEKYNMAILSV